jgi:hypothetical protein
LVGPPVRTEREVDRMTPIILHERHGPGRDGLRLLSTVTNVVREREREREREKTYLCSYTDVYAEDINVHMYAYAFIPPTNRSVYGKTKMFSK